MKQEPQNANPEGGHPAKRTKKNRPFTQSPVTKIIGLRSAPPTLLHILWFREFSLFYYICATLTIVASLNALALLLAL